MPLSDLLMEVLVCPACGGELEEDAEKSVLRCKNDGREFPIRDGVPMMLAQEVGSKRLEVRAAESNL